MQSYRLSKTAIQPNITAQSRTLIEMFCPNEHQNSEHMDKPKLMIVDDKEQIGKILFAYLSADYEIVYMQNPVEALAWLYKGNTPDLIISDIRMPEMRGDEFLHYLKNNELFRGIPVVMLSCEDSTSERIRMLEEGAQDYIVKPFNPMELKIRIKRIVG